MPYLIKVLDSTYRERRPSDGVVFKVLHRFVRETDALRNSQKIMVETRLAASLLVLFFAAKLPDALPSPSAS